MNNEISQRSWFYRNKSWTLPTGGCLLGILVVLCIAFLLFKGLKETVFESEPYKYAVKKASNHPKVKEVLGENITTESIFNGRITIDNAQRAEFQIPLRGNKNKGFVFVLAERNSKTQNWKYKKLFVLTEESMDTIHLK